VVFPPPTQNPASGPVQANRPVGGALGDEPRRVRTVPIRSDAADSSATPAAQPAKPAPRPAAPANPATSGAAPAANAPLSLSPQAGIPPTRTASNAPTAITPAPTPSAPVASGGYLVQIASQRNEADAQASYRALQGKYPTVLGSRSPLIRRADLGEKGIYYRAMVGPFGTSDEAAQFCGSLKSAGGQCVIQRN
jgi:cell division septation protein DedD